MQSPRRALAFGVVVALGVVLGAGIESLSAQASDPRIGSTWRSPSTVPVRHPKVRR
jgi:hypothetical protein